MSIFNLNEQNSNLDNKIVAGLERLSQVFRILLWEKAKQQGLSPIQIQILIFIRYHKAERTTVSYLAKEFNLTKPTISEAVKILEQKQLIRKYTDNGDSRSYTIQLTETGEKVVFETENFTDPLHEMVQKTMEDDKLILWENISNLIVLLNKAEIISVQRTCYNCKYFSVSKGIKYCDLLSIRLHSEDIRIDCGEFEMV